VYNHKKLAPEVKVGEPALVVDNTQTTVFNTVCNQDLMVETSPTDAMDNYVKRRAWDAT
jgi:hypothetical protein